MFLPPFLDLVTHRHAGNEHHSQGQQGVEGRRRCDQDAGEPGHHPVAEPVWEVHDQVVVPHSWEEVVAVIRNERFLSRIVLDLYSSRESSQIINITLFKSVVTRLQVLYLKKASSKTYVHQRLRMNVLPVYMDASIDCPPQTCWTQSQNHDDVHCVNYVLDSFVRETKRRFQRFWQCCQE